MGNDQALSQRGIGDYLDALASSVPTPGGGSAVAVAGTLAAALAEMVCNLTIGRPEFAAVEAELCAARDTSVALRARFQELAAKDEAAYGAYVVAADLPKSTDEEKATRRAAMQSALRTAADVPLAVGEACLELLTALQPIARLGNPHVLSDALVSALLAEAALRGAMVNVRVNARLMKDLDAARRYLDRADEIEANGGSIAVVVAVAITSPTC